MDDHKILLPKDYKPGFLDNLWVKMSGRSWWQGVYRDGKIISEWDTLQNGEGNSSRWEEVNRKSLRTLILIIPEGKAVRVTSQEDNKFFQFKVGVKNSGPTEVLAHVIGVVINSNGDCVGFAYEPKYFGLITDESKVSACPIHAPSPLDIEGKWKDSSKMNSFSMVLKSDGSCYCSRKGFIPAKLIKFEDNVLNMEYQNLGPLGLDVLRLKF